MHRSVEIKSKQKNLKELQKEARYIPKGSFVVAGY